MKRRFLPALILLVLILLAGGGAAGVFLYNRYSEGTDRADLYRYFSLGSGNEGAIMLDGEILDDQCRILNGICYLKLDTIQNYLHNRFYYSEADREIRYTDALSVTTAALDQSAYTITTGGAAEGFDAGYTVALSIDNDCYIALDFVEKFVDVRHVVYEEPFRAVIDYNEVGREYGIVKKNTAVRWFAGVKSDILTDLLEGDAVRILDEDEVEGWIKVATADGLIGYVKRNRLGSRKMQEYESKTDYEEPEYTSLGLDEPIRMGFHAVYNSTANRDLSSVLDTAYNINVISPTWFSLSDNYGNFTSLASAEYVEEAHGRGVQVWGLVEDINNTGVDIYEVLAYGEHRAHLIDGLISEAERVGLDGINIDLEDVRSAEGVHFVQFLRELSIACREHGLVLSVDNYPPNSGNAYNDYAEQGVVADYVILMGYDEHWGGSGDPGSTASQPFVERSLDNLLAMVDASKVINAMPFYTRMWVTSSEGTVTDFAVPMKEISQRASDAGMTIVYDGETMQNYGEGILSNGTAQMWIEDIDSIENKCRAAAEREVAGVAAWRLGYETREVWEMIGSYIQ